MSDLVRNPADRFAHDSAFFLVGQVLASTLQGDKEDVDLAVKSAKKAYESWSKTPPHVRARHMYRLDKNEYLHDALLKLYEGR